VPVIGPAALAIVPADLFRSTSPAPSAPTAAPVASPCTMRAASSAGTLPAVAKISMATAWTAIAMLYHAATQSAPMDRDPGVAATARAAAATLLDAACPGASHDRGVGG
jgi:hypothetical protein